MSETTKWRTATKDDPCPKCGKTRCLIAPDNGAVVCRRDGDGKAEQLPGRKKSEPKPVKPRPAESVKRRKVYPELTTAITSVRLAIKGAKLRDQWHYHRADYEDAMTVVRFDLPDGSKQFRPFHPTGGGWAVGDPEGVLPLYCLPDLKDGLVYVVEGEKCVIAAQKIGLNATTSAHGAQSAAKTDWAPLAGRDVVILPDRDKPGDGYASDVTDILTTLTPPARVKVVRLGLPDDSETPDGYDIADWCDHHDTRSAEDLRKMIEDAAAGAEWIEPKQPTPAIETVLIGLDTIEAEPVEWLWLNRFVIGGLNLIVGAPGGGKTFTICDLSARITTGTPWPDGADCVRGSVLIANAEDDPASVIRPRFDACGGDPRKVMLLDCVRHRAEDGQVVERGFTLADVNAVGRALDLMPDCRAVVIDPVGSFLGERCDAHRDNEVRGRLQPLVRLARERRIAVLVVMHTRKGGGGGADDRALGSRAFVGLARSVYHLTPHPHEDGVRLLLPGKMNNGPQPDGLAFTIGGEPATIFWQRDPVKMTADEAYGELDDPDGDDGKPGPKAEKTDAAKRFLTVVLADGPRKVKDIETDAKAAGIAMRTVRRAAKDLDVIPGKSSFDGGWEWRFKRDRDGKPILPELAKIDDDGPNTGELGNLATFGISTPPSPISDTPAHEDDQDNLLGHLRHEDGLQALGEPEDPDPEADAA